MPAAEGFVPAEELERRRIERAGRDGAGARPMPVVRRRVAGPARRTVGGGALFTAIALGLQEVFDPVPAEVVVEEIDEGVDDDAPVSLYLVSEFPGRSRALVRPWLID